MSRLIMAIRLFQHRGIWYVEINGKRRSLQTRDKGEARRLYTQIRREYLAGKLSHITGKSSVTLEAFRTEYLAWAEPVQPRSTFRANRLALDKLIHHAGPSIPLDQLSAKHVDRMVSESKAAGLSTASINNYIRHMRMALNKAKEWGHVQAHPLTGVKEIRETRNPPAWIDRDGISTFLSGIQDHDLRRMVVAYLATGRRRSELLSLEWEHVNLELGKYRVTGKTGTRWYPINGLFRSVLDSMEGERAGRVFKRWTHPDTVSHLVKAELIRAGYPDLHLHHIRHTFASWKVMDGEGIKTVQELLGHTSLHATLIYAHLSDEHIRQAAEVHIGPVDLSAPNPLHKKRGRGA